LSLADGTHAPEEGASMNGGAIQMAQYMAGHADPRTTKLYDRRRQQVTRGEVERIRYERKARTPGAMSE
jgi:hypothetical protein